MDWDSAKGLPFGLLILFGGGLSLAGAIERNGLADFLGAQLAGLQGLPMWAFIAVAVVGVMFAGELLSNTAAAVIFIPICAAAALGLGWDPMILLIPVVWAANCSFMLPVATPPNAIVYGSGWIDAGQMARVGFWLNLTGIALMLGLAFLFAGRLFPAG
jgi:sodium-dependent dicarboxylate transporter 2/3/5